MMKRIRCTLIKKSRSFCVWMAKKCDTIANRFVYPSMNKKDLENYQTYKKLAVEFRQFVGKCNMYLIKYK